MTTAYKRLAALRPADTSEAELYEVPASTEAIVTLNICNQDTAERTYDVAYTDVDGAESDRERCYRVNAAVPAALAARCRRAKYRNVPAGCNITASPLWRLPGCPSVAMRCRFRECRPHSHSALPAASALRDRPAVQRPAERAR